MAWFNRLKTRIAGRYRQATFRPYVRPIAFAGEDLKFHVGDLFGEDMYGPHHTHWPELEWVKRFGIRRGDTVVDCGANHGFSTVLFSRWAGPEGCVHAFEPFGHNMRILQKNLALNNATNVRCHEAAVGAARGQVTISAHSNARIVSASHRPRAVQQVPIVTLDDVLGDAPVAFIKIDVEGHEQAVLEGARSLLANRPRLDVELHVAFYAEPVRDLEAVLNLIPLASYTTHIQPDVDGPIVRYDPAKHTTEALARSEVVHLFCA
jgi:FkbM family methyltransferase